VFQLGKGVPARTGWEGWKGSYSVKKITRGIEQIGLLKEGEMGKDPLCGGRHFGDKRNWGVMVGDAE